MDKFFNPDAIAVIGASNREGTVGAVLMDNLVGKFAGKVFPVNPKHDKVHGLDCFPAVGELPETPDLAVVATPAHTVPGIVEECGKKGVGALAIISAGFGETGREGKEMEERVLVKAKAHNLRIIGPNCLGIIRPSLNLNLTFLRQMPQKGHIAFFSQSGAMGTAILDWAAQVEVGFSVVVSVGNMLDVDFGDLIDHFGRDPETQSVIMYLESVTDAAHFMSAARAFARTKPLLVIKAGKHARSAEAVASHTGSLAGQDEVYEAAFRRVGVTRVANISDLFICAELLAKQPLPDGPRLCVITNAGGPGILAADAVLDHGGELAELSEATRATLRERLPAHAATGNPVDVLGDAGAARYRDAGRLCAKDDGVDGLIVVYSPQGEARPEDAAQAVIEVAGEVTKPVLTSWMGGKEVTDARRLLLANGVPTILTPEQAVRGYLALHRYACNLKQLYETPEELPVGGIPPHNHLRNLLRSVCSDHRELLTETEAKQFLDVYGIPVSMTKVAHNADEAGAMAEQLDWPVVLKVFSPDITHKSDVGGVLLRLGSVEAVRDGFEKIRQRVEQSEGSPQFQGVTVQRMVEDITCELILGAKRDPVFGAVLLFGRGGTGVELYRDAAIGFPPINQVLARRLMEETKVFRLLRGYRKVPPADLRKLEELLVRFSQLIIDFPEIREFNVNPLAVKDGEFIALDARVVLDQEAVRHPPKPRSHLVIAPYPREYIEEWRMPDGRSVTLRPIRPEDESLELALFDSFSEETWRQRFFGPRRAMSHREMTRFTNIDYRRTMAIVAVAQDGDGKKMLGVARLITTPATRTADFAVVVGDPWQEMGLGEQLTEKMINIAGTMGVQAVQATVLANNSRMQNLCRKMGFAEDTRQDDAIRFLLPLKGRT